MQIRVSGRHMSIDDAVQSYCVEKMGHLSRYYDRVSSVDVVLDAHAGAHFAEIIVHSDGTPPFVASEEHADLYAAIDLLRDKIERQLTRHKEKMRNRKHP
jgi:putative sigma-54 modulation protein